MSATEHADTSPTILVSVDRLLVERLLPGAIAEAETRAAAFADSCERCAWVAGRLGVDVGRLLSEKLDGGQAGGA